MIPVMAQIGDFVLNTSLFPKGETYILPLKDDLRRKTNITVGDLIAIEMTIQPPAGA
jgi:hypothetical protein